METAKNNTFDKLSADIQLILDDMEKRRRASIFPAIWQGLLIGLVLAIIVFLFTGEIYYTLAISIGCSIFAMFFYYKSLLSNTYKKEIMPRLVATLGDDIHYDSDKKLGIGSFRNSKLFEIHKKDNIYGEDCIYGMADKTAFSFCESSYLYEYKNDDGDDKTDHLFDGLSFEADFNKDFHGVTLLCNKRPKHLDDSEYPKVNLESPAFNKKFNVYATDEVEARYILSPALQERFVRLVENLHKSSGEKKLMVSFYNSRILILIPSSKNRFEARILSRLKLDRVRKDFLLIHSLMGIVEELNLNNRIWTKR